MKSFVVLSCLLVVVFAQYKYDNLDVDEIIANKRLMTAYTDCFLEKGKCTPEGLRLKGDMQDALETGCAKCTESQKDSLGKMTDHLIKNEPVIWKDLTDKYDSDGTWRKKYEKEAKERGVVF